MSKITVPLGTLVICLFITGGAIAQIQIGTVRGTVVDPSGAVESGAKVILDNSITGYQNIAMTDQSGQFTINNVPFARYALKVSAAGFQTAIQDVSVRSNFPVVIDLRLALAGSSESISVEAKPGLVETDSSSTELEIHASFVQRRPGAIRDGQLQRLIATAPGLTTENNGLLHIRGVDDGVLYVIDGVPAADRIDRVSASPIDAESIQSMNIISGNIPAEFGGRAGAVVAIQPKSGISAPFAGSISAGAGNPHAGALDASLGGSHQNRFGFFVVSSASRSDWFLDPVDPRNFNNSGGAVRLNVRSDWHPTANDIVLLHVSQRNRPACAERPRTGTGWPATAARTKRQQTISQLATRLVFHNCQQHRLLPPVLSGELEGKRIRYPYLCKPGSSTRAAGSYRQRHTLYPRPYF